MNRNILIGKLGWLLAIAGLLSWAETTLRAQATTEPKAAEVGKANFKLSIDQDGVRVQAQATDNAAGTDQEPGKVASSIGAGGITVKAEPIPEPDAAVGETTTLNESQIRPRIRRHRTHRERTDAPKVDIGKDFILQAGERVPGVIVISGSAKIDGEVDDVVVSVNSKVCIRAQSRSVSL